MGSCGDSTIVDDASDESVIEQHLCSELSLQPVPGPQTSSELACNAVDSNIDHSITPEQAGSANFIDVTEPPRDALVSECESAVSKQLDDGSTCLKGCTQIKVSNSESEMLCSHEEPQDKGNGEMPSEFISGNDSPNHFIQQGKQKDEKINIFSSEGDIVAVVENKNYDTGLLPDTCNHITDSRHSETFLDSEPLTVSPVGCNQKSELEEIMRVADPLLEIVGKCDALCGTEAGSCKQISTPQGSEMPSDVLHTEIQKYGMGCNSPSEERVKGFVDVANINDTPSQGCLRSSESSPVDSPHKATQLEQGIAENDMDPCAEEDAIVIEQNIDVAKERNLEMMNNILPLEENTCNLKDSSIETTTNCTIQKPFPFSLESDQPDVFVSSSLSKDMPDLLVKDNNCSISSGSAADNFAQTDNEGKDIVRVDCIPESKCPDIVSLPSRRNNRRSKSGRKTQTKRALRKCKNKASVPHPGGGMKIILDATRKKRSCFSKPARSSIWGLLGNIKQFFEQGNEYQVSEVMCQGLGKARVSCQSGKVNGNGASSSSLSSTKNPCVSTTRVRLKIKLGKEVDLSCSSVLVPEVVDGLASAPNLGPCLDSHKVASNAEDQLLEDVSVGKSESLKTNMDKDALVVNGQIADNHSERAAIIEKSDGDVEEICAVPPKGVVEALKEPVNDKDMDPGTSPDSEVINTIPDVQVGERHNEDVNDTVLGSSKELSSTVDVTRNKRGKKKGKHSRIVEDGSQGAVVASRAKHSKNRGRRKNSGIAVCSDEPVTYSADVNATINPPSRKELSMEHLLVSGDIEHAASSEALKVKSSVEIETVCSPAVIDRLSESHGLENVLSSAKSSGRKLPKSLKSGKVSKAKSKSSDATSRKKTACRHRDKQRKPVNKSEVKGKVLFDQAVNEAKDHLKAENGVNGNHKLDATGKINAVEDCEWNDVASLDVVPGVGLGEQHHSLPNAWVRCDDCHKWRRIPAALADQIEETNCTWTCKDSEDKVFADCSIPQEKSNAEINAELGLSDASGEEDAYEGYKNYRELENQRAMFSQESTFTRIYTNEFLHRSRKDQTIDEIMVCSCKPPLAGQLGCGEECLNRMLNIECVQGTCPCGDLCSNQQFQKREYAQLKWFKCGKKGYGLKAIKPISKGQFLTEYVGEVLDNLAYENRQREYALKGHRHFYFMTLDNSEVIDASAKGNLGRFINHSCDPNCRTEKWMVNGEICIGLFALRDIKQDEEVTFDYNYVRVFGAAAKKCYCGSPQCRGYIGGDPLKSEVIVQGDSDEEFPEPVMLTEYGEVEDSIPSPSYFNNIDKQTARRRFKDRNRLDRSITAIRQDGTREKESYINPSSAISQLDSLLQVEDLSGKLPSSVDVEAISQQMEDVTSKPMPALEGYTLEAELVDKNSSSAGRLGASSATSVSKSLPHFTDRNKESNSEIIDRHDFSESHLLKKTSRLKGSIKKGKDRGNPPNALKAEVKVPVPSIKLKKVVEGSSNGRFEAVQEKLNELLDGDGGISKRKDATKGYLKLLFLTAASGERSGGEAIQSNRDLSMILDALLKTKSRAVLNDIINKNGLQMLHNIMKQYKRDFKKIPILRKLLKVLEYLAASNILTFQHIIGGPPCLGMESFRESMLSLTEHDDKQVHQIARSFRDRWIPRPYRKLGYLDMDDSRVESHRSLNCNRISALHNHRREQEVRPTEAIDCVRQSMLVTTSVDSSAQDGSSALSQDGCEINGTKKRKRKSRWDQPAETKSDSVSYPCKEQKIDSGLLQQMDASINCADGGHNIPEDVPPGFSCPLQPQFGSSNALIKSNDLSLPNAGHSGSPSDAVIGRLKERFDSRLPVSYGMSLCVVRQHGIAHAEIAESWVTAPGIPFNPFPPLPPYPRDKRDLQSSNSTNVETINGLAEGGQHDTGGLASSYSDDMVPSTTGSNLETGDSSFEDNKHVSKRVKCTSYDLGKRFLVLHLVKLYTIQQPAVLYIHMSKSKSKPSRDGVQLFWKFLLRYSVKHDLFDLHLNQPNA
ncbi:hypothetical protein L6164_030437 [Bauhinia variegata]|uniref:Uncharacterized protein n=1 Tax=Bauhinia variegata TaxID=167791 RepID=A0ACB9LCT1_BAUVA|nr:hypothetical protein L6164_030437 [Bauhinia variegata]